MVIGFRLLQKGTDGLVRYYSVLVTGSSLFARDQRRRLLRKPPLVHLPELATTEKLSPLALGLSEQRFLHFWDMMFFVGNGREQLFPSLLRTYLITPAGLRCFSRDSRRFNSKGTLLCSLANQLYRHGALRFCNARFELEQCIKH